MWTKKIFEVVSVHTYFHQLLSKRSARLRYDAAGPTIYREEIFINYCCPFCLQTTDGRIIALLFPYICPLLQIICSLPTGLSLWIVPWSFAAMCCLVRVHRLQLLHRDHLCNPSGAEAAVDQAPWDAPLRQKSANFSLHVFHDMH